MDFLVAAGQTYWQIMPLGHQLRGHPTHHTAFARNVGLISPKSWSNQDGSLSPTFGAVGAFVGIDAARLADGLRTFKGIKRRLETDQGLRHDYEAIVASRSPWLDDYALFVALKDAHEGAPWTSWSRKLATREPRTIARARREHADRIEEQRFLQYSLRQWRDSKTMRTSAASDPRNLPIFVA